MSERDYQTHEICHGGIVYTVAGNVVTVTCQECGSEYRIEHHRVSTERPADDRPRARVRIGGGDE